MKKENKQKTVVREKTKAEKILMRVALACSIVGMVILFTILCNSSIYWGPKENVADTLIYKIIDFYQCSRKVVFIVILFLMFLCLIFAIISKIKKNPKIRARFWMRTFFALFIFFLLNMIAGFQIDYVAKPIIYLYPEEETEVLVSLGKPEKLTHTYPKYQDAWRVTAQPNGDLKDEKGRSYYALYWEGIRSDKPQMTDGFIVKGSDTIRFLEEKLAVLGLTEREANEFIVYWLPELENNEYNFIRFETKEEIDENMPLYITPKPDTTIRVMMEYRSANKTEQVETQQLPPTPERKGFVAVEWGGTRL